MQKFQLKFPFRLLVAIFIKSAVIPLALENEMKDKVDRERRRRMTGLAAAVRSGDRAAIVHRLNSLRVDAVKLGYSEGWVSLQIEAVASEDFSVLGAAFGRWEFVGVGAHFFVVAPLRQYRQGAWRSRLSLIAGEVSRYLMDDIDKVDQAIEPLRRPGDALLQVMPVTVYASAGNACGAEGEAFITPDAWEIDAKGGPSILDLEEQGFRFREHAPRAVGRTFELHSARFMMQPLALPSWRQPYYREYVLHDAGHSTGVHLDRKIEMGVLNEAWLRGVEEHRADGVGMMAALATLPPEQVAAHVLVNLTVRLGLDVHRPGGLDADQDVVCCALTLQRYLEAEVLKLGRTGRLEFVDHSVAGMVRAAEHLQKASVETTRRELALRQDTGVTRVLSEMGPVHGGTAALIEHLRQLGQGMHSRLR
jgi:hypothetical protein